MASTNPTQAPLSDAANETRCKRFFKDNFSYDSPRNVRVGSVMCGCSFRILQFIIFSGFFCGYGIWFKNVFSDKDPVESALTTKLLGVAYTNFTGIQRIWDAPDYVIPPIENGAKFVMTNVIETPQILGTCDENPFVEDVQCNTTCRSSEKVEGGHGVKTGRCVDSSHLPETKVCEISGWCPVENENGTGSSTLFFLESKDFALFIKNDVYFPKVRKRRLNINPDDTSKEYMNKCRYDPENPDADKPCPVFKLDTIVNQSGYSFEDVAKKGGIFQVVIDWKCEWYYRGDCQPKYTFRRLDSAKHSVFRGFHFRYADHYIDVNRRHARILYKATGIRLIVTVQGYASYCDLSQIVLSIVTAAGAVAVATIICEMCMGCCGTEVYEKFKTKKLKIKEVDSRESLICCGRSCSKTPEGSVQCAVRGGQAPKSRVLLGSNCFCVLKDKLCWVELQECTDSREDSETQTDAGPSSSNQPDQCPSGPDSETAAPDNKTVKTDVPDQQADAPPQTERKTGISVMNNNYE